MATARNSSINITLATLAILWPIALLYLSLAPAPPQIEGPLGWDKLQHAAALGVMSLLISLACLAFHNSLLLSTFTGFASATLFGGLIELFQKWFTTNRQADIFDFVADLTGALFVSLIVYLIVKYQGVFLKKLIFIPVLTLVCMGLLMPVKSFAAEAAPTTFRGEIYDGTQRLLHESATLAATPFQVENNNIFITLGVLGATALTYTFDRDIQAKLQTRKSKTLDSLTDAGTIAGDPFLHLGLAALVYGGGIAADSQKWKETGEMMGEALILSDVSTFIFKEAVGRGRPVATTSKNDFKPFGFKSDYDSFPSMHTSSSFALASVMASTTDSMLMKSGYYTLATFVGFSRMYQSKHWASDVIFGAALGEICGRIVTSYHASQNKMAIAPLTFDSGGGLALVGKW